MYFPEASVNVYNKQDLVFVGLWGKRRKQISSVGHKRKIENPIRQGVREEEAEEIT